MNFAALSKMTRAELIAEHDRLAATTVVGTGLYRDEIFRRDSARQNAYLLWFTGAVTILTAANVVLVWFSIR